MTAVDNEVVTFGFAGNRLADRIVQLVVGHAGPQQRPEIR